MTCWSCVTSAMISGTSVCLLNFVGNGCRQDSAQNALGSFEQLVEPNRLQLRFETLVEVEERVRHFHATVAGALRLKKAFVKRIVL